ncbi:MAG: hypothetical protein EU521_00425 [Promethearchaeota archaeon]|nr:MAG: hypothetical protein EU521_00425 [Candidatus Lokiarchaeota archaeon]
MNIRDILNLDYILPIIIILWSIIILSVPSVFSMSSYMVINILVGVIFSGLVCFNIVLKPDSAKIIRILTGGIELTIGFLGFAFSLELVYICLFLMLGSEFIGLSAALALTSGSMSGAGTTRRPETLSPEPSPEPQPL